MLISNCTYSHQRASRRPKLTKEHLRKRERWPKNSWAPHRFLWGVKLQNWPVISRDGREKRFQGGCVGSMWYRPPATSAGPGDLFGNATNPKVRDRYWPSVLAHFEPGGGKANRFRGCPRNPQLNGHHRSAFRRYSESCALECPRDPFLTVSVRLYASSVL